MAEQLLTTSIQAPGFQGLNKQDSAVGLDSGYATRAENCVIDKYGRIGTRQGWVPEHTAVPVISNSSVRFVYEFVTIDGTAYTIVGVANKIYKLVGGALVELTYGGGGASVTITDDNWSGASLNSKLYLYQAGHDPLIFDPAVSTTTYRRISEDSGYLGTVQPANVALSAFGRIWTAGSAADKSLIQFSDILNGAVLSTGTSGTLDVSSVWPDGEDEIVSLAAHNGFLFVFGRRQILIYSNPDDPYTMRIQDTITGVGCLARDSVVVAGTDIIFLSDTGVRSLQRTIQEKSAPLREMSLNVKDDLITILSSETPKNIKAVYSDVHAFYLLSLPESDVVFCFDMRQILPNGSARATTWNHIKPTALHYNNARELLIGTTGFVGKYGGYSDNGSAFEMRYFSSFFDFGSPTSLKILKKVGFTLIGNTESTLMIRWGFEYQDIYYSRSVTIEDSTVSFFGEDEYGIGEYATGVFVQTIRANLGGTGAVLQLGIEASINSSPISIQRIDCYVKQGKTL